jgi:hypothetical protein
MKFEKRSWGLSLPLVKSPTELEVDVAHCVCLKSGDNFGSVEEGQESVEFGCPH